MTTKTTPTELLVAETGDSHVSAPRFLISGIDTVQCAYYLYAPLGAKIDFVQLRTVRDRLRDAGNLEPEPLSLGDMEFLLAPYGSKSGYPFVLSNADYRIECGENNNPPFYVTYRSEALWREPAEALHRRFLAWATGLGFEPLRPEGLSRVDFCFDYVLPVLDFDEDNFLSRTTKDSQHRASGTIQTFTFGRDDIVLRVYDKVAEIIEKSHKMWLFDLWGTDHDVWRIEWQVRKDVLRRYGIRTYEGLCANAGALLSYLAHEHDSLRVRTTDGNRSRWPVHPLWADLLGQLDSFNAEGGNSAIDPARLISDRITRISLSMYGYLKQIAALRCVQRGRDHMSNDEALRELESRLTRVHDPLTWNLDVERRIKRIQLGQ